MAAFFGAVIGFGFDDPGAEPQFANSMTNDFSEQVPGENLRVAVEKCVRKARRQARSGRSDRQVGHDEQCLSGLIES
ncbi:hypothetical protein D3C87_1893640 [compost metagenome]